MTYSAILQTFKIMGSLNPIDVFLRGASASLLLLMSIQFVRSGHWHGIERVAALFLTGTVAYILLSSAATDTIFGPFGLVLIVLATLNSVFFWWFSTALFDDEFTWEYWRFIPFVLILGLSILRVVAPDLADEWGLDNIAQQVLIIAMTLHIVWLALVHRQDDLVEPRRLFRLVFAVIVGITVLIVVIAEFTIGASEPPTWLLCIQATSIFIVTVGFAIWLLKPVFTLAGRQHRLAIKSPVPVIDPADGRTYRGSIRQRSTDLADLQGCALVFCQTQTWRRLSSLPHITNELRL